jgi:polyhydroxyalkanoate synthesis regulator protein
MALKIKRYANRKLHAEGDVKYLSMLELADRAVKEKDGEIQVLCDRTGRDLTHETLSRALYERLKDYGDEDRFLETGRNKPTPFDVSELTKLIALVPARKKV